MGLCSLGRVGVIILLCLCVMMVIDSDILGVRMCGVEGVGDVRVSRPPE